MGNHALYKYSVTCRTEDLAVLHCLRALCQFAERHKAPQIGWGGTGVKEWQANSFNFKLRFTSPEYRTTFLEEANRLLPMRWELIATDDDDPASPQR